MKHVAVIMSFLVVAGCVSERPATRTRTAAPVGASATDGAGGIVYAGGDGSSIETAVIIKAPNEAAGVRAESEWVRQHHPGWRKGSQALISEGNRMFDRIEYTTPEGKTRTIYFDITDFFGKW